MCINTSFVVVAVGSDLLGVFNEILFYFTANLTAEDVPEDRLQNVSQLIFSLGPKWPSEWLLLIFNCSGI